MLKHDIKQAQGLSWKDVEYNEKSQSIAIRLEMEDMFREEFMAKANGPDGKT